MDKGPLVRVRFRTRVGRNCPRTIQTDRAFSSFRTFKKMRSLTSFFHMIFLYMYHKMKHFNPCLRQEQIDIEHLQFSVLHSHLTNWGRCDGMGSRSVFINNGVLTEFPTPFQRIKIYFPH